MWQKLKQATQTSARVVRVSCLCKQVRSAPSRLGVRDCANVPFSRNECEQMLANTFLKFRRD